MQLIRMKRGLVHIILIIILTKYSPAFSQNKSEMNHLFDSIPKKHNLFIELGGTSLIGSVGYAYRKHFRKMHFLEIKLGTLYWQDLTHPIYDDYYLLPHIEATFNYKLRKLLFSGGFSFTPVMNPFLFFHKNYNCSGGPTSCQTYWRYSFVGINLGLRHSLHRRIDIKYTIYGFQSSRNKKTIFPWAGVTVYYKLKH